MAVRINEAGLEKLKQAIAERIYTQVVEPIAADARRYVPVDTGRLRNSIGVTSLSRYRWRIAATAPYSVFVELGTRHMAPQSFLRVALYQRRGGAALR